MPNMESSADRVVAALHTVDEKVNAMRDQRLNDPDSFGDKIFKSVVPTLAGLVLGYDPWALGMQMHQVDVEPLLDKMGVEYDPAAKYLGRNGKYIGKPESAVVNCCPTDTIYDIRE